MAKSLNDILRGVKASKVVPGSTGTDPGVDYAPKSKVEQDFVAKHKTEKHEDRVGNKDDVYKGKTEYVLDKASESRHGYKKDDAEKVYESLQVLEEATAKQINDRLDSLVAAKKAEKAGDKKAQYGHLADYHTKYATHVKKSADVAHHKSQAEKYRSASKAFNEAASCNMTNEGTYCPVHEMTSCKEQKTLREKDKKINEEKHVFHVHIPSLDTRLHKMVDPENDGKTSEPIGNKPKPDRLKITVPGDRRTATNKAAKYVAKNYGTNVKFTYSHKVDESLVAPLLGGSDGDESAEMAKTQLRALANKALALAMHLNDDQVVEPWVQAKIAVAKDNVSAVHDYMVYGNHDKPEKEQTAPYEGGMDMSGSPRNTYPNFGADVNIGRSV